MRSVLLVTGAFQPEIDRIRQALDGAPAPDLWYGSEVTIECMETGVGNLESALRVQKRILDREAPLVKEILFFGSAGLYSPSHEKNEEQIGRDFGTSDSFHSLELAVLQGNAKVPGPMTSHIRSAPGPAGTDFATHLPFRKGPCNSPDSVTLIEPDSEQLQIVETEDRLKFENMEAFGIVRASGAIPFTPFFALTNHVGPSGSREWAENYRQMSERLQIAFIKFIELRQKRH